jgi:hypothetical protein
MQLCNVARGTGERGGHHRQAQLDGAIGREGLEAEAIVSHTRDIEADKPPIIETFRVVAYQQDPRARGRPTTSPPSALVDPTPHGRVRLTANARTVSARRAYLSTLSRSSTSTLRTRAIARSFVTDPCRSPRSSIAI